MAAVQLIELQIYTPPNQFEVYQYPIRFWYAEVKLRWPINNDDDASHFCDVHLSDGVHLLDDVLLLNDAPSSGGDFRCNNRPWGS